MCTPWLFGLILQLTVVGISCATPCGLNVPFLGLCMNNSGFVLSHTQLCSLAVGFVVLLLLSRRSEYTTALKILSVSLWFLTSLNVTAYLLGSALVPAMVALFMSAAVLSFYQKVKDIFTIGKLKMRKGRSGEEVRGEETVRGMEPEGSVLERGITQKTAESVSEDLGDNTSIDIEKGGQGSAP